MMFFGKTIFLFRLSCRVDENEDGVDRGEWVLATQLHSHNASTPVPYFVLGLSKASCNLTSRLINFLIWLLEFGVSLVLVSPSIKVTLPSRQVFRFTLLFARLVFSDLPFPWGPTERNLHIPLLTMDSAKKKFAKVGILSQPGQNPNFGRISFACCP